MWCAYIHTGKTFNTYLVLIIKKLKAYKTPFSRKKKKTDTHKFDLQGRPLSLHRPLHGTVDDSYYSGTILRYTVPLLSVKMFVF